ncbi:MAG: hypothetical protein M3014_07090, partial [Chloroflexota bacterium]|nr:hypothetical protein [Chloroflexota bacterium]
AQQLKSLQQSVAGLDPELARRLGDASEALKSNDPSSAGKSLKELGDSIGARQDAVAEQKQLGRALAQVEQSKGNIAQMGALTRSSRSTAVAQGLVSTPGSQAAGGLASVSPAGSNPSPASAQAASSVPATAAPAGGTSQAGVPAQAGTPVALASPVVAQGAGTVAPSASSVTNAAQATKQAQGASGSTGISTGTQQSGKSGQGQSGQSGQGATAGSGNPGQGQSASLGGGSQSAQGGQSSAVSSQPAGGWGKGHSEPVYAPSAGVKTGLTPVTVQGQTNSAGQQSSTNASIDANSTAPSQVPYEQVYGRYQEQAGKALDTTYIPQGYRDLVKQYFSDIAP